MKKKNMNNFKRKTIFILIVLFSMVGYVISGTALLYCIGKILGLN